MYLQGTEYTPVTRAVYHQYAPHCALNCCKLCNTEDRLGFPQTESGMLLPQFSHDVSN